jgi:hypothetical protein
MTGGGGGGGEDARWTVLVDEGAGEGVGALLDGLRMALAYVAAAAAAHGSQVSQVSQVLARRCIEEAAVANCATPLLAVTCASALCRRGAQCLVAVAALERSATSQDDASAQVVRDFLASLLLPLPNRRLLERSINATTAAAAAAEGGRGRGLPRQAPARANATLDLPPVVKECLVGLLERAQRRDVEGDVAAAAGEVLAALSM